jgi:hypothetical protein
MGFVAAQISYKMKIAKTGHVMLHILAFVATEFKFYLKCKQVLSIGKYKIKSS